LLGRADSVGLTAADAPGTPSPSIVSPAQKKTPLGYRRRVLLVGL